MDVMLRRLWRMPRGDGGDDAADDRASAARPRRSVRKSAFSSRVGGTVQSAAMPLRRLMERVRFRLSTSKPQHARKRVTTHSASSQPRKPRGSRTRLASLKFCVWSGTCGWSVQRKFVVDEAQFVWVVGLVTTVEAWETDGIRPGDILESVAGVAVASLMAEEEILALLQVVPLGTILRFRVRAPVDQCRLQRVLVVVDDRPVGISIVADGDDSVAVVIQVPDAKVGKVRVGDVLTEVNGEPVVGWVIADVMALVAACQSSLTLMFQRWTHAACGPRCRDGARMVPPRPAKLRRPRVLGGEWRVRMSGDEFHDFSADEADSEDEDKTVVLVWRGGSLGLTLMKDDDAQMPIVNRLTGKGCVQGVDKLRHGYHLASINGAPTHRRRFRDVLRDLERSRKPLWLVFLAPHQRVSLFSTSSRDGSERSSHQVLSAGALGSRWSTSSSLLSLDESWDVRATARTLRRTSTGTTATLEAVGE